MFLWCITHRTKDYGRQAGARKDRGGGLTAASAYFKEIEGCYICHFVAACLFSVFASSECCCIPQF